MEKYKEKPDNKSTFEHKLIYYLYIFSHTAPVGKSRQGVDKKLIFLPSIKIMVENIIIRTNLDNTIKPFIKIINSKLSDYNKGKEILKEYDNIMIMEGYYATVPSLSTIKDTNKSFCSII